jgi:hypothetical protein
MKMEKEMEKEEAKFLIGTFDVYGRLGTLWVDGSFDPSRRTYFVVAERQENETADAFFQRAKKEAKDYQEKVRAAEKEAGDAVI